MHALHPLTIDQMAEKAPSILSTEPMPGASNKYSFVSTIDAIELIMGLGWEPYNATETHVRIKDKKGFQKHMIRFSQNEMLGNLGDERFDLVLNNSHDRGSSFKLCAGVFRLVCENGMVIGNESFSYSHRHVGFDQEKFKNSVRQIAEDSYKVSEQVENFKEIELTRAETGIYAQSAAALISDDPQEIDLNEVVRARRGVDEGQDLWRVFNRTQENVIKGGIRRYGKTESGRAKRDTMKVKSIDRDIKLNKALWLLTEQMAALKKGQ